MRFNTQILSAILMGAFSIPGMAGIVNPNISAIGQVLSGVTDDPGSVNMNEATLELGEAEFIMEAALNPYFKGWFTIAAGDEGFEVEEAYGTWVKGLPWGLGMKAGKYRLGFGKLNPVHPHAYPFQETPGAWSSLMPGEEGFNEVAVQASILLPSPGSWAPLFSVDLLQGGGFHPDEEKTAFGWLGRFGNSFLLGDGAALEAGVSGATGMDHIEEDLRGYLAGGDLKVKFFSPGSSQLTLQGEGAFRRSHSVDSVAGVASEDRMGFYAFADFRYHTQYNAGVLYDQVERAGDPSLVDRTVTAFVGFAVLEESTLLRAAYSYSMPQGEDGTNALSLQFIFSMGPHKPHQF